MSGKFRTSLKGALIGVYLLLVSALLILAIDQSLGLVHLYADSLSPSPASDLSRLSRPSIGFWAYALAAVIAMSALFMLVWRRSRRLLPISFLVLLVFAASNLYSGRHILPQILVPPKPISLVEQYTQALATNDLEGALRLTDSSHRCTQTMAQVFSEHQSLLEQSLGADWQEAGFPAVSAKSLTTYYDKPIARWVILQPVPAQQVRLVLETEYGSTARLGLRLSYEPYLGTRYICGKGMDS